MTIGGILDVYIHPVDKSDLILASLARIENEQRRQGRLLQVLTTGVAMTEPTPTQPDPTQPDDGQVPAEPTPAQ